MRLSRIESECVPELLASSHSVIVPITVRRALIPEANGRRLAARGMLYPANDETAMGVLLSGADVTDSDADGMLLVHGLVFSGRLPEAPSAGALAALPMIMFVTEDRLPAEG